MKYNSIFIRLFFGLSMLLAVLTIVAAIKVIFGLDLLLQLKLLL